MAHRLTPEDRARLSKQTVQIIERLFQGPALNTELARIALKYTGRISDAREAGYTIICTRLHGGLMRYELIDWPVSRSHQAEMFRREDDDPVPF